MPNTRKKQVKEVTEKNLMERLRSGDTEALSICIDRYSAYAFAVVSKISGGSLNREDIEETVSDSFVSLWYSREKLKDVGLKQYIGAIARNKTLDRLRALRIVLPLEDDYIVADCPQPEAEIIKSELSGAARDAVETLPEPDREIFKRHYFLYEKTEDISHTMGINASTVRSKLSRGREKLKEYLEGKGFEYENTYL